MTHLIGLILCLVATAARADGEEPMTLRAAELPRAIRALHAPCASRSDLVNLSVHRLGKMRFYFVSCPRAAVDTWPETLRPRFDPNILAETPIFVYSVDERWPADVTEVRFPVRIGNRANPFVLSLPPYAAFDHEAKGRRSPWIVTLWKPDTRSDMCKIRARWKIVGGEAELWRWEEAPTCTNDGPQYRTILDRGSPRLSRE
jgi:hypothetical protein